MASTRDWWRSVTAGVAAGSKVAAAVTKASLATRAVAQQSGRPVDVTADAMMARLAPQAYTGGRFNPLPRTQMDVPFGPGQPLRPAAIDQVLPGSQRTEPRMWQYPVSTNLQLTGRNSLPDWTLLRAAGHIDFIRRCIELRKNDIISLGWDIGLSQKAVNRVMADDGCTKAQATVLLRKRFSKPIAAYADWWEKPDRYNGETFSVWLNKLLDEQLVFDSPVVYPKRTLGSPIIDGVNAATHSLVVIDGWTIKPLLENSGGVPQPPNPAYQQILYGVPRGEFTMSGDSDDVWQKDALFYRPRNNPFGHYPYGFPPVEQCLGLIDLWLKREEWLRSEFGAGTNPNTWAEIADGADSTFWTPDQRRDYQKALNEDLAGQTDVRHGVNILPPGLKMVQQAEFAEKYKVDFDNWLLTSIASYFDVLPTQVNISPKSGLGGAGWQTGETEKSEAQARRPTVQWLVDFLNDISQTHLGMPRELTFRFVDEDGEDALQVTQARQAALSSGQMTLNDVASETGRPLWDFPEADEPIIITRSAIVFVRGEMERQQQAQQTGQQIAAGMQNQAPGGGSTDEGEEDEQGDDQGDGSTPSASKPGTPAKTAPKPPAGGTE